MADPIDLIGRVGDLLLSTPEGKKLFEDVRRGAVTPEEATLGFVQLAQREGFLGEISEASREMDKLAKAHLQQTTKTTTGLPQLNPLWEGYLAERASLDGDIPEMRSGPLPEDGFPAVPVKTHLLDPVAVGWMLERASSEVSNLLDQAVTEHAVLCERLLGDAAHQGTSLERVRDSLPPVPVGVPGYEAGQVPALRTVTEPPPLALANLSPNKSRELAWKALATTQGRVSLSNPILTTVLDSLLEAGLQVAGGSEGETVEQTCWSTHAFGAEDLSENFNFAKVAADYFISRALERAEKGARYQIAIDPLNQISDRHFGWSLTLRRLE